MNSLRFLRLRVLRWTLATPIDDRYHIEAWLPAAPRREWRRKAHSEVLKNGRPVVTADLDPREPGDRWHAVGAFAAGPADQVEVTVRGLDDAGCVADALHVTSDARYNGGRPVSTVALAPMDGTILRRAGP